MYERLTSLQEGIIPKKKAATDDDLHQINELIQVSCVYFANFLWPLL